MTDENKTKFHELNKNKDGYVCKNKIPDNVDDFTLQIVNKLLTASQFIENNAPQISNQIDYLKLFFSKSDVSEYIDYVIRQSYEYISEMNKNKK